jgi:hypothetical protein
MTTPTPYGMSTPPPYGGPPAPSGGLHKGPTGRELLSATWALLKQDRELVWLPAMGALLALVAAAILFVPGWFVGDAAGGPNHHSWAYWAGGILAGFGASVVSIYFQSALVIGANERADGGDPTLRSCLNAAWAVRGRILKWALLATTVGALIRAIERRFGTVGNIIGFLAGLAWAIATFLVVPVVVAEDVGPIEAAKRSGQLIKQTWGTSLRTTLRFGVIQAVIGIPAIIVLGIGFALLVGGGAANRALGAVLALAGGATLLAMSVVFRAISGYARALIYRYAVGQPVPGVDAALFAGVFQPRKRRGFFG